MTFQISKGNYFHCIVYSVIKIIEMYIVIHVIAHDYVLATEVNAHFLAILNENRCPQITT